MIMRTMSEGEIPWEIDSSVHCFKIFEREKYVINMHKRRSVTNQTIKALRAIAKERGLRRYSKLRKAELVSLLENSVVRRAACEGRIDVVKLCEEWGATNFHEAMYEAALKGHIEIVKLCRGWLGYDSIHRELLRHDKHKLYEKLYDEVSPVAWNPARFFDRCLDEEDKTILKEMWKNVLESVALANSKREKIDAG